MIYRNSSRNAVSAMENHRLAPEEYEKPPVICPICGEENDDFFYVANDEIIGCEKCVETIYVENMF